MDLKLTLNGGNATAEAKPADTRLKTAAAKRTAQNEPIDEAWTRILAMSLSDKEREQVQAGYNAWQAGKAGRLKDGKFNKAEAIEIGKRELADKASQLREERLRKTLDNKPTNYYVLTNHAELAPFVERLRLEVAKQREQWAARFERLGVETMTAGDFEGTGIDAYSDLSIGFSIWLPILNEGYYLAYGHVDATGTDLVPKEFEPYAFKQGDDQLTRSKALAAITPYLSNKAHGKTFHMGAARYDLHIAQNDGYTIKGCVWDTLDAMNTLNEHEDAYGLKPLIQKYGPYFADPIETADVFTFEDLFTKASPAPFSTQIVGIYAINDVKYGWSLFDFQFEKMQQAGDLFRCYTEVDKDLPETDVFMERCGFRVDFDQLRALEKEFEREVENAKQHVYDTYEIDAEFVRKMDRSINAKKVDQWVTAQKKRITKMREKINVKQAKLKAMEAEGKTHLKSYESERQMLVKYKRDLAELAPANEANAPQEVTEFSMTNGNHLAYLIYDFLGVEDKTFKIDRKKKRSTAANVLDMYYEDEPALKPLATLAEYTKLLTTYVRPILGHGGEDSTIEVDGRIHTNFKAGGTTTGRYSSSTYSGRPLSFLRGIQTELTDATYHAYVKALIADNRKVKRGLNMQNLPAKGSGVRVRNAFVPRDGWLFIGSDLGQIEPRIQAHIMYERYGDNSMRQIFVDGVDLYTTMAMKTFGLDEEHCVDKAYNPTGSFQPRKLMKTGVLAVSYDQSESSFAQKMNVSTDVAKMFFANFNETFPSFKQMVKDIREGMKKSGYVETLYGRKRRFPLYKEYAKAASKDENQLMQYYIQRKALRNKKAKTDADRARLSELETLIAPLAEKRNLVSYWERAAFNAVIQGSGADILKMNGNRLAKICMERGWELNASIHDELKISLPAAEVTAETIELVKEVMTDTASLSVPLVTDTVIETKWMQEYATEEWCFASNRPIVEKYDERGRVYKDYADRLAKEANA